MKKKTHNDSHNRGGLANVGAGAEGDWNKIEQERIKKGIWEI
jgi:hypothetical protein